ncbi:MAG TPA: NADH-quinone oxidoreductase subunit J [Anaerolineales bacterium]|nr:NADH-quinone oxidoreductase subunit J [Anaerolineales bacterium]
MTLQQILFFIFGAISLGAGVGVVTARKLFHAALWLLLAFFGVAGLYVLLEAPFFAAAQLFVYMGAIGILIIFAIMLTRGMMRQRHPRANRQWWLAGILAALFLATFVRLAWQGPWTAPAGPVPENSLGLLGLTLVDPGGFALPFEVASVLLVVALIGAVTIVRER